jgi:hypothetical protein
VRETGELCELRKPRAPRSWLGLLALGVGALGAGTLGVGALGVGALGAGVLCSGCDEKPERKPKTFDDLHWEGLRLGMAVEQARARMKELGWKTRCRPSPTVVFLDGDALATRWIKQAERGRTLRCDAHVPRKKAVPKRGKARRRLRAKLFFLDGTLRQMNIVLAVPDERIAPALRKRWGAFKQVRLSMYMYGSSRPGQLRALSFRRGGDTVLWLRRARVHELVFVSHEPAQVKALRSLVTLEKGG